MAKAAVGTLEHLENRLALAVTPSFSGGVLTITYDPLANQSAVLEIEEFGPGLQPGVSFYSPSTPSTDFWSGVDSIVVNVVGYDTPGVNNNSLTIKGISTAADRIIVAGAGRTAAGRWSDGQPPSFTSVTVGFSIAGIDHLTVTAGGVLNVSGSFTNDTDDASIKAIGQGVESNPARPLTAQVTVAEVTPVTGVLPQPYLFSNYVEVAGARLDIFGDISATDSVILRAGEQTPESERSNLVLPYDITVTGNPVTGDGVVDLFSTKNIVQLTSSTITTPRLSAISNAALLPAPDGPWMIDLGSPTNDFDSLRLGMVSAPGDKADSSTEGRIGIRDIDDLAITDFGILSSTGQVTIETGGALTFAAPVKATGLVGRSDHSITSLPAAVMTLGDLGLDLSASATFDASATGDISLAGRIIVNDTDPDALVSNKIQADGAVTIGGGIFSPLAGSTWISGITGVTVAAPIQVGGTKLDANSRVITVFDHDLVCLSDAGSITVNNVVGNNAIPFTIQATNIVSFNAFDSVSIAGSVFTGTLYGDPSSLLVTEALPAITITANEEINLAATSLLRTSSYETNFNGTSNPLVGLISLAGASRVNGDGAILADGALDIDVVGDVYLNGPTTARENVAVQTSSGSISVAGKITATGAVYTSAVDVDSQRMPNVILSALNGTIVTGAAGVISAGTATVGGTKTFGRVDLEAQQDIQIAAAIDTVGEVNATSKFGAFDLSALLRTNNGKAATITAGNGILQTDPDLARIVTDTLTLTNTGAADGSSDIDLRAKNNQIKAVSATNLSVGGDIAIRNNGALTIAGLIAERDDFLPSTITLASTAGISQTGAMQANDLVVSNTSTSAITLTNSLNNVDRFAASNPVGAVSYVDNDDFETGVIRGLPLGVEIRADALSLSSVLPYSTVRVVSGLQYRTLSIAAGTQSGTTVGTVEFVTTSNFDTALATAPFTGTLRNMVRYVNDNGASYVLNGTRRAQPMALVFDEAGYAVEQITLAAALPAFVKPVLFDGGRLEETTTAARLGIAGSSKIAAGLTFGLGSSGSTVNETAIYGFSAGSGIVLSSSGNTITSSYVGLRDNGNVAANRIGIEIVGTGATNNTVGTTVFDVETANRIGGNTEAGILVRDNANGNRVYGNVIGRYDDGFGAIGAANGDGVRIFKSTGNQIGTPDADQSDMTHSVSNVIAGNTSSGVRVLSSVAGSYATANTIRNNLVTGNQGTTIPSGPGAGIMVQGSRFVVVGGDDEGAGNAVVGQTNTKLAVHGVALVDSGDIQVLGNSIGVNFDGSTVTGNKGDGVNVLRSQRVSIAADNVIVANQGNGVAVGTGSTGVTVAANRIGLLLDDTAAGNAGDGVAINTAVGNTIAAGNRIAYNANGVSVTNSRATTATSNRVIGSEIFANLGAGVRVVGGSGTTIGGTAAGATNLILQNKGDGIRLESSTTTGVPTGNLIQGNFIGTNANYETDPSLGNSGNGITITDGAQNTVSYRNYVMNNRGSGISLLNGTGNMVGGAGDMDGNVVYGNASHGVAIGVTDATRAATGHRVYGNLVVGNAGNGVDVSGSKVSRVWIGQDLTGTTPGGRANGLIGNAGAGVRISAAQQVAVQGNSITDNAVAGIQLVNGANTSVATNFTFTLATAVRQQPSGGRPQVVVTGSLRGAALQQYSIDLFANDQGDGNPATGAGYQGRRYLGRLTVTADRTGVARFTFTVSADVTLGEFITATATSLRTGIGSTSAFSNGVEVTLPPLSSPRR